MTLSVHVKRVTRPALRGSRPEPGLAHEPDAPGPDLLATEQTAPAPPRMRAAQRLTRFSSAVSRAARIWGVDVGDPSMPVGGHAGAATRLQEPAQPTRRRVGR